MRGSDLLLADETFTLITPQDSETTPAVFVNKKQSRTMSPTLTLLSRPIQGDTLSSRTSLALLVPVVRSVEGIDTVVSTIPFNLTGKLPKEATQAEIEAAYTDLVALLATDTVKAVLQNGERII